MADKNGQNRGGKRVPSEGKKLGRPKKIVQDGENRKKRSFTVTNIEYNRLSNVLAMFRNEKQAKYLDYLLEQCAAAKEVILDSDEYDSVEPGEDEIFDEIEMSEEQEEYFDLLTAGNNCFITGGAGTGKSFLVKKFRKWCRENGKEVMLCAPTGIAAKNIGGRTIHSAFSIKARQYYDADMFDVTKISRWKKKWLVAKDVIVIDEISMCRADLFEVIIKIMNMINENRETPVQLILCGDFAQLPPVVTDEFKLKLTEKGIKNPEGWAFLSPVWKELNLPVLELKEIHRQDDAEFMEALSKLRRGDKSGLAYIDRKRSREPIEDGIYICATNKDANSINQNHYTGLYNDDDLSIYREREFSMTMTGTVDKNSLVCEPKLKLIPKARVMFLVNDTKRHKYINGSFGTVINFFTKDDISNPTDEDLVIVRTDEGETVNVKPYTWTIEEDVANPEKLRPDADLWEQLKYEKIITQTKGSYTQIPLKLGWAITIHKSQGQTYEKVNIKIPEAYSPGQYYVAISRAKSIENTFFTTSEEETRPDKVLVSSYVSRFYNWNTAPYFSHYCSDQEGLEKALDELFDDIVKP